MQLSTGAQEVWQEVANTTTLCHCSQQQHHDEIGKEDWKLSAIATLTHLYQCPQSENGRDAATLETPSPHSSLRANQAECVRGMEEEIEDFLQGADEKIWRWRFATGTISWASVSSTTQAGG